MRLLRFTLLILSGFSVLPERSLAASPRPEALLVVAADLHSAYERTAQFVAHVDRLRAENPGVPLAVLLNGDTLEYGNAVARRTSGAIDFALFRALADRGPTVINLGNHEPEFHDPVETVRRLEATGLKVIGNLRDRATGQLYAAPALALQLGPHALTLVGLTTDRLNTYRLAIRPQLDLADPVVYAREKFPELLRGATLPVVLSHAGLRADRDILPLVPPGTLFAGAHDHLRLVHDQAATRTVYFHSGSWMEFISVARLERRGGGLAWTIEQRALRADDPVDPALADLVRTTLVEHLTAEETQVVGRTLHPLSPTEAARFAVAAAARAAGADVAVVGATTFGAGLPAGEVTRFAFDACVRFDGPLYVADLTAAELQPILARCNPSPDTPLAARTGENLIAVHPETLTPNRTYRFVTTDWIAKNPKQYLGDHPPALTPHPILHLKAAVLTALAPAASLP